MKIFSLLKDGYYFDATENILYINPDYLKYYADMNNQFIVTTVNFNRLDYQMFNVNINKSLTQAPTGTLE